jgi:hypothetical protein
MIKNGHLSAVFLLRKSLPAVRICQATTLLLAFLLSVSAYSQTANPPAAPDPSPAASNEGGSRGRRRSHLWSAASLARPRGVATIERPPCGIVVNQCDPIEQLRRCKHQINLFL